MTGGTIQLGDASTHGVPREDEGTVGVLRLQGGDHVGQVLVAASIVSRLLSITTLIAAPARVHLLLREALLIVRTAVDSLVVGRLCRR